MLQRFFKAGEITEFPVFDDFKTPSYNLPLQKVNTTIEMCISMDAILTHLNNNGIPFERAGVHFWTDGATKHFKNRFVMCYLSRFREIYGAPSTWNFNESYHGKGAMDGIGAVLKHTIYMCILRGQEVVSNAREFFEACTRRITNVVVIFRSSEELEERSPEFLCLYDGAREARGILRARCVRTLGPYLVQLYRTSKAEEPFATCTLTPPC